MMGRFVVAVALAVLVLSPASAFRTPVRARGVARTSLKAVEESVPSAPEKDAMGFPVVSDDPREALPTDYVDKQTVVLEELRKDFLREKFAAEDEEAKTLGWTKSAEIWNSRAAMFGITTGLLTEYWTGESVVDQVVDIFKVLGFVEL